MRGIDWLPWVFSAHPGSLAAPAAERRVTELLPHLPGDALQVLELSLATTEKLDLSVRLTSLEQVSRLAPSIASGETRDSLLSLAGSIGSGAPLSALWLEFDLSHPEGRAPGLPPPVVCVRLERSATPRWIFDHLLPALAGERLHPLASELLEHALRALPSSAHPLYLFDLRARGEQAIRLELSGPETGDIPAYLERLGVPAPERATALLPLIWDAERIHLSFDLRPDGPGPRIGLEASFRRPPEREPRWRELFSRLVQAGLASPRRRELALSWPAVFRLLDQPAEWPRSALPDFPFFVRALSHIKLATTDSGPAEAKVYLLFGPHRGRAGTRP